LPPSSIAKIGQTDQANHQYDQGDFWAAASNGNLPTVSFLKAPGYQDGQAGYSDPLAEQTFLVNTINQLQKLPQWKNMAIIITCDDSDGWYDHVMSPIVNQSYTDDDALTGNGNCGIAANGAYQGRCGYGPRLPLLIISPFAKENFVDHSISDQSSILKFIEDNWLGKSRIGDQSFDEKAGSLSNVFDFGNGKPNHSIILDPSTGQPTHN
jgi:phospholipase C